MGSINAMFKRKSQLENEHFLDIFHQKNDEIGNQVSWGPLGRNSCALGEASLTRNVMENLKFSVVK